MAYFFILACLLIVFRQTKAKNAMTAGKMQKMKAGGNNGGTSCNSQDKGPAVQEGNQKGGKNNRKKAIEGIKGSHSKTNGNTLPEAKAKRLGKRIDIYRARRNRGYKAHKKTD